MLVACAGRPATTPSGTAPVDIRPLRGTPAPVRAPARWAIPSCPLGYEMLTRETTEMAGAPAGHPVELETFALVDAKPRDGLLELALSIFSQPATSKHRPRIFAEKGYAAPILQTDGTHWTERDGPTQAWSALGTQGGLVWFFPPLPSRGEPGATVAWEIGRADTASVLATEARRGSRGLTAPAGAQKEEANAPVVAEVRLERWEEPGVAHLTMEARYDLAKATAAPVPGVTVRGEARFKGSYVVLASGRLLSAEVRSDSNIEMDWAMGGKTSTQHHVQHAEKKLHLVSACDGPTAPKLDRVPTREERAIADYATTWQAIANKDRDKALSGFTTALRKKHGDARLWNALVAYRTEREDGALMPPLLLQDDDVSADAAAVRLRTHGTTPDRSQSNVRTPVRVEVTLREENGRFAVAELRGELEIVKGRVLDVSESRLAVPKGWPPR